MFLRLAKQSQFIPLQNVVYFITLPVLVRKILTFYTIDVLLFKCSVPGPTMNVGPCHHGMARPQVADGGTASNMEGSCE